MSISISELQLCDITRKTMVFSAVLWKGLVTWCRQSCSIENYNKTNIWTQIITQYIQCEISYHSQNFHWELQEVCTDLYTCCCHRSCSSHLISGCNTSSDPHCSWCGKLIEGKGEERGRSGGRKERRCFSHTEDKTKTLPVFDLPSLWHPRAIFPRDCGIPE